MGTAVVFPGQGAQYLGMGQEFFKVSPKARDILQECSEGSGLDLDTLITYGPKEVLAQTINTQPAIYAVSLAIYQALNIKPDYLAGFSLGQYSALAASGVFSIKEGARLLKLRGQFMQEATPNGQMGAILGLDCHTVKKIVAEVEDYVAVANINCPLQVVVSGTQKGVNRALETAKKQGAKRIVQLNVSGAFHCSLMESAALKLKKVLDETEFGNLEIPVIGNETAKEIVNVKTSLLTQLTSPVLWQESIEYLIQKGVKRFIEVGPGKVLSGLIKKIDNSLAVINIEVPEDLAKLR